MTPSLSSLCVQGVLQEKNFDVISDFKKVCVKDLGKYSLEQDIWQSKPRI